MVAICYPFSLFCEMNISLLSLQTQPNTAPNLFQRGVEYGKYVRLPGWQILGPPFVPGGKSAFKHKSCLASNPWIYRLLLRSSGDYMRRTQNTSRPHAHSFYPRWVKTCTHVCCVWYILFVAPTTRRLILPSFWFTDLLNLTSNKVDGV